MYAQKAVFDRICARIAEGESLRQICLDPEMPAESTVFRWLKESHDAETLRAALQLVDLEAEFGEFLREKYTRVRTHARA